VIVALCLQPVIADMLGVHRIVEAHAASRGSEAAVIGAEGAITYRELNQRANALARYLIDRGLRRGSRAVVKMEPGPEMAVALLAVLKAGAAYTWLDLDDSDVWPVGISLLCDGEHQAHLVVSVRDAIQASSRPAPNLPILTRGHDIACVMPQRSGLPGVLVPHATIAALQSHPLPTGAGWSSEPGALDLWIPLMAGAAVVLTAAAEARAA
jgi:non-ribosomal peptide synthetase component F